MFPKARVVANEINKETEQVNTLPDRQETETENGGSRASDLSNRTPRPKSPENFLHTPPFLLSALKLVPEILRSSNTDLRSDQSQSLETLEQWEEDLGRHFVFDFRAVQDVLGQALNPTVTNYDEQTVDNSEIKVLEESDQNFEEDDDEEYHDLNESLNDTGDILDENIAREETADQQDSILEQYTEGDEPFFGENLFTNPLQALEDQENDRDVNLPAPFPPPETQDESRETWITRFLYRRSNRTRRLPRGPGRFVNPPGSQVLFLIVHGIETIGAQPKRGDTALRYHPTLGRFVSFSSPLRHCWSYTASE